LVISTAGLATVAHRVVKNKMFWQNVRNY